MVKHVVDGITHDGIDIEVSITTEGDPEQIAEKIHMYVHDAAARAVKGMADGTHPDETEGLGIMVDFDRHTEP